jgi:hypothetical protein
MTVSRVTKIENYGTNLQLVLLALPLLALGEKSDKTPLR